MNKQVIQIIFLILIGISVFVIYSSEKLVASIKNIKDVNSAGYLLKISGFLVLVISLYVIYINR